MSVGNVFRFVIDDVIKSMKNEFINEGVSEQVLMELQNIWESKLLQAGSVAWGGEGGEAPTAYDNRYYTDIAHAAAAQTMPNYTSYIPESSAYAPNTLPSYSSITQPTFGANTVGAANRAYAQTHNMLPPLANLTSDHFDSLGRPQQYMPPTNWHRDQEQQQPYGVKLQPQAKPSGRGPTIPQHDGPSDDKYTQAMKVDQMIEQQLKSQQTTTTTQNTIPQYDGGGDKRKKAASAAPTPKHNPVGDGELEAGEGGDGGDGDEELDSDLDDPDDEEPDTEHIVLCQFEKVTRIKNKRKCNLKDGIMHLNGRDYLFHKANGEFDW